MSWLGEMPHFLPFTSKSSEPPTHSLAAWGFQRSQLIVLAREVPLSEAKTDTQPHFQAGKKPEDLLFPLFMSLRAFSLPSPGPILEARLRVAQLLCQSPWLTGQGRVREHSNIMTVPDRSARDCALILF